VRVIKLDGRHNLYHKGYRYAFKFSGRSHEAVNVERVVKQLADSRWDCTFLGKLKKDRWGNYMSRPYYIGIKDELTATVVMLKL
jgi:hypothetical protein